MELIYGLILAFVLFLCVVLLFGTGVAAADERRIFAPKYKAPSCNTPAVGNQYFANEAPEQTIRLEVLVKYSHDRPCADDLLSQLDSRQGYTWSSDGRGDYTVFCRDMGAAEGVLDAFRCCGINISRSKVSAL